MGDPVCVADELVQFTRPERIEFGAQSCHAPWFQTVVVEPSFSPARDQAYVRKHTQMLRDRRPAHREIAGEFGHRVLAAPQQLQQAATGRLGYRSHQVRHHNTLVIANVLSKPPPR